MFKQSVKVVVATLCSAIIFLWLYTIIGYERTELLAFSLLIGLSVAAIKSN